MLLSYLPDLYYLDAADLGSLLLFHMADSNHLCDDYFVMENIIIINLIKNTLALNCETNLNYKYGDAVGLQVNYYWFVHPKDLEY
jgi:hypothetical protein